MRFLIIYCGEVSATHTVNRLSSPGSGGMLSVSMESEQKSVDEGAYKVGEEIKFKATYPV